MNTSPAWAPNSIALTQDPVIPSRYIGTMAVYSGSTGATPVTAGMTVNFKVTLGSWGTVEKGPFGADVPNRVAVCGNGPTTVYGHVFHWGNDTIFPPSNVPYLDLGFWCPRPLNGLAREVFAHLPPTYGTIAAVGTAYPVVYALDGQEMFDPSRSPTGTSCRLDLAADANAAAGNTQVICIAIDNTFQQVWELGPSVDPIQGGGGLPDWTNWFVNELKPEIDRIYQTNPGPQATCILGTQLSGLAAFRLAWDNSATVQLVGSLSPEMTWNNSETAGIVAGTNPAPPLNIWLDTGTAEQPDPQAQLTSVQDVDTALLGVGFTSTKLDFDVVQGGTADPVTWGARLPQVLAFLFP